MRRRRRRHLERRFGPLAQFAREWEKVEVTPEARRTVAALAWFLAGVISILALFGAAGSVGAWLAPRLFLWMGWGTYVIPFTVSLVALTRLDPERFPFGRGRYFGLIGAILAGLGLLHLPASSSEGLVFADEGKGGGYVGWAISYGLRSALGETLAIVVLAVVWVASLVLVSNRTPGQFFAWVRSRRLVRAQEKLAQAAAEPTSSPPVAAGVSAEEADSEEAQELAVDSPAAVPVFALRSLDGVKPSGLRSTGGVSGERVRFAAYEPPPLELLSDATTRPVSADIKTTQQVIQRTLETFGITVEMADVCVGPTVTQYTLRPAEGVKLSKILALHNDLALALAAHPLRIEAPIPGKGLVGIEVPNKAVSIVRLRSILAAEAFTTSRASLTVALGKDVSGESVVADIGQMPHLLIAGATGSGKSVLINSLLVSLLCRNGPARLKFILIDPKRVELTLYNGIPHLLAPVVTESEKTIHALRWAVAEMDRRYELLSASRKRDVSSYNVGRRPDETLSSIVIVVDELADIMARHAREVEGAVIRLAQIARAVSIHLILATQRPSVDVITGLIKANITNRIAFKVASSVDARTILDAAGAEKLLGSGDMLFLASGQTHPRRLQGAYVSEEEVKRVVGFLTRTGDVTYDASVLRGRPALPGSLGETEGEEVDDALLGDAESVVVEAGRASTSLLQRRLRIGYARAARIMDLLEERGVIGPPDGARPREVLVPRSESTPGVGEANSEGTPERRSEPRAPSDDNLRSSPSSETTRVP